MSISTAIRDVAGVTVVDLSGRITLGEASGKLRETVRNLLDSGVTKMVLNLAQVSYIDSSGLGELVSAYTTARSRGCTVKLLHVQAKVQDLLTVTKLYTVFESHTDEGRRCQQFLVAQQALLVSLTGAFAGPGVALPVASRRAESRYPVGHRNGIGSGQLAPCPLLLVERWPMRRSASDAVANCCVAFGSRASRRAESHAPAVMHLLRIGLAAWRQRGYRYAVAWQR